MSTINFFHVSTPVRHAVASRPSNYGPTVGRAASGKGLIERLGDWADQHPASCHRLGSWEQYCYANRRGLTR